MKANSVAIAERLGDKMAVISFKCPNCDGELIFDPATQKYKCEYCISTFTQEELDEMTPEESTENHLGASSGYVEENVIGADAAEESDGDNGTGDGKQEEAVMYTCPSCGAEIITDATTAATFCYYCHNPVILGGRLSGEFLPDKIIPFEITKEQAVKQFLEYVGKKKFIPKAFFSKQQIESITGVYFPYWNYSADVENIMQGDARNVRTWTTGDIRYTETKYYHVSRHGVVSLTNLTENALQKANAELARGVMPYDFEKMQDFNMGYLSGFMAEKRDIEKDGLAESMQGMAKNYTDKIMRDTIKYSHVTIENSQVRFRGEDWAYCLLPVWTITYKGKNGKIYYYSMNGQTGEVCGELPVDHKKLAMVSGGVSAAVFILGLLGGLLT